MSAELYETLRGIVRSELEALRTAELAVVQEQHPHESDGDADNYACTVVLRDSGLVLRRVPVATGRAGVVSIPDVGELVLVQFLHGDLNAPVIVGSLYNDEDRPPVNSDGQAILHLPLGAGDADAVHLEASSVDRRELLVRVGGALELRLTDDDPVVQLDVGGGKATLTIDSDGSVTLASNADLTLEGNSVTISGNQIAIEATGTVDVSGAAINLN